MGKRTFILVFFTASITLTQFSAAFNSLMARAADKSGGETLVIRHVAKVPDGREYVLGVEEINNITDIYYYNAAQSPVASEFLNNGYSLSDEKNRLIETDIVSNGGKLDLEYTPALQKVNVTYYKVVGENEKKMGTIEDSAYVGEEYIPQAPVYDGTDVLATLIGDNSYTVEYGKENNFKVTYAANEEKAGEPSVSRSSGSGESYSSVKQNAENGYVRGYPDNTFRPERDMSRGELYSIMYSLSGGNPSGEAVEYRQMANTLLEQGIIEAGGNFDEAVTWSEFYESIDALNGVLAENGGVETELKIIGVDTGANVKRAEAVAVINELYGINRDYADLENPFTDVYEDDRAYLDIMNAAE